MTTAAIVQALVLGTIGLLAFGFAVRRLLPTTSARALTRLANRLDAPGQSRLRRRLGHWLRPARAGAAGCGSGDGCSQCGSCASAEARTVPGDAQPLVFVRKPKADRSAKSL